MSNQLNWVWQQPNWPRWRLNSATLAPLLASARRAQGEAIGRAQMLTSDLVANAQTELLVLEGFNTSAIEGEKLDIEALRSSAARRLGVRRESGEPAPLVPRAIEGLIDVLQDATRNHDQPLRLEQLNKWQAALFPSGHSGLQEIRVGSLRGDAPMRIVSGPHQRERVHYEAPPREGLDRQVQIFIDWFNTDSFQLDGLVRAGLAHLWFEILHPYEDGNGRVGRALLDKALAQDEKCAMRLYSLSAQLYRQRDEYYAALERASTGNLDATDWLAFFTRQIEAAAKDSEFALSQVFDEARFWIEHGAQSMNDRQRKAVKVLLDQGRAAADGGMTNARYVAIAETSPATAQRDLAELVERGIMQLAGAGRSARYDLQWVAAALHSK